MEDARTVRVDARMDDPWKDAERYRYLIELAQTHARTAVELFKADAQFNEEGQIVNKRSVKVD